MSVFLAALMSSISSTLNSGASLFTVDVYKKVFNRKIPYYLILLKIQFISKDASDRAQLIVSKVVMCVICVLSILWLPVLEKSSDGILLHYIQSVTSYFGPPVVTVFTIAILWERATEPGAFWALISGFAFGVFRVNINHKKLMFANFNFSDVSGVLDN